MTTQEQYIARLKEFVEAKFGRRITTIEDCDALSEVVGEATNIKLDSRAYAPIFITTSHVIAPRPVTLSTLARYLGYNSWSEFCSSASVLPAEDVDKIPVVRRWGVIILTLMAIAVVAGAIIFLVVGGVGEDSSEDSGLGAVVEDVEMRWVLRTMEECNMLRAYRADSAYVDRLDSFAKEYDMVLEDGVLGDLRTAAKGRGVEVSNSDIEQYSDSIATRCRRMYEVLYYEGEK